MMASARHWPACSTSSRAVEDRRSTRGPPWGTLYLVVRGPREVVLRENFVAARPKPSIGRLFGASRCRGDSLDCYDR